MAAEVWVYIFCLVDTAAMLFMAVFYVSFSVKASNLRGGPSYSTLQGGRGFATLTLRDNIHSHLRHAKRPMAVGGSGGLSNGCFLWKKWDFCS